MIRSKILYAALLVASVLFFILYRGVLSRELMIFTILFPIFPLVLIFRLRHAVHAELRHDRGCVQKGETYQWVLYIHNRSLFSTPNATAMLEYCNGLSEQPEQMELQFPIMPHNTQMIRLQFHGETCGRMELKVSGLTMLDPLRLFRRRIKLQLQDTVLVLPLSDIELPNDWTPAPLPEYDSDDFSKEKAGDDPSEIFDYHEYHEGDAVSRIHWKLSSKHDRLIVKDYSLPLTADCLLFADYRHVCKQPDSAYRLDTMLSAVFSVMLGLLAQGMSFRLVYYDHNHTLRRSEPILSEEAAAAWMQSLLQQRPLPQNQNAGYLNWIPEQMGGQMLIFTPSRVQADMEQLATLDGVENVTLFTVTSAGEQVKETIHTLPFRWIPVVQRKPTKRKSQPKGGDAA